MEDFLLLYISIVFINYLVFLLHSFISYSDLKTMKPNILTYYLVILVYASKIKRSTVFLV